MHAQLVLLHSNDIHSRLENAARIASIIADERRVMGAHRVLAVDIGDHMDRMRMETEGSEGKVNLALLQEAGYEAITLGNNEGLTYTSAALDELYSSPSPFAVVCANMKLDSTGERPEWMQPGIVLEKNGLTIGLVGATANFAPFYKLLGWTTTPPLEAIREQVNRLRSRCDVMVVMSHLGLPLDRQMAEEVPGIDLILGAHTHHLLEEPIVIGETTICAAGKFGDYVGRVEIGLDQRSGRPIFNACCLPTGAYAERPEAASIIHTHGMEAKLRLGQVLATLNHPLPARVDRESALPNLLAAGLRRLAKAEIGIVNAGQVLGGLAIGDVSAGELHALCPSPINPCRMMIAGIHLREALEQSLLDDYVFKPIRGFGFRGEVLGMLAVDGLSITYDASRPPMYRIVHMEVNGEPFRDEQVYAVGSIDMFSFRAGYESLANAESYSFFLPEFIRDIIAGELLSESALASCHGLRWQSLA
ncbi:bifunctional metallophosphatase/5'-nucleotidase [Paenibacillus paeoniae]|uniref:Bifunctional metallophosphatase/5'-nucleotidase n=2 Tax=Paenibacillus paeoniae TaxID=2292705 RepID=A0A371P0H2_9BACL|nr:bifunctional metallophosphatase/5'-nucleotidase [Paenibacillus paeoniae]